MNDKSRVEMLGRRGQLLAELFLQELGAEFVARPTTDLGYDFFVGFANPEGGVNMAAVEVKSTERPVQTPYVVDKTLFRRLANSNIPVLLLVANVKENRLFYALPGSFSPAVESRANTVSIPLTPLDDTSRNELRELLTSPQAAAA